MKSDLQIAFEALSAKQHRYTKLWNYYKGDQPLVYSTDRLKEVFGNINARFVQNWCAVIVDATTDRIEIAGWNVATSPEAKDALVDLWKLTEMEIEALNVHNAVAVFGEAFVLAGTDDTKNIEACYNDPRNVHVFYEAANPRKMRMAAKWWVGDDGKRRMTLYYPDRFEYYVSQGTASACNSHTSMVFDTETYEGGMGANPYGEIPVFHFVRDRREVSSEISPSILSLQDAVNKQLADMMVTSEFSAFQQRYVIGNFNMGGKVLSSPGDTTQFPASSDGEQPTEVGAFPSSDLNIYLSSMDKIANSMAIISRTPKHYFFDANGVPSGEALLVQEAPLTKKCGKYIEHLTPVWRNFARFILKLAGRPVNLFDIEPQFADVRSVQPYTQAQTRATNAQAGIPIKTQLRDDGWTEDELKQMEQDAAEMQTAITGGTVNRPGAPVNGNVSESVQAAIKDAVVKDTVTSVQPRVEEWFRNLGAAIPEGAIKAVMATRS